MSWARPYGWGCHFESKPTYCYRYHNEGKTEACRKCSAILTNPNKDKFLELFDKLEAQEKEVKGESKNE